MTAFPLIYTAAAFDLAAGAYDAYQTIVGLKMGSGVEGNSIINFLSGSSKTQKPSSAAIIAYNLAKTGALVGLGFTGNPALIGGSIGGLFASEFSHVQAGLKWRYLNRGGQIDRTKSYTWWQKLLGIGWE